MSQGSRTHNSIKSRLTRWQNTYSKTIIHVSFQGSCTPQARLDKIFEVGIWQGQMEIDNTLLENMHKRKKYI
jgi:hypothetical protein